MLAFVNPPTVHAPAGAYSHTAVVPAGTELVFLSGQVGVRPDGSLPESVGEQADQVFANIAALLASHGLDAGALIKLTMFIVAGRDLQSVRAARAKYMGSHRPASTAVFVAQLADPAWHVEVEAVAARPSLTDFGIRYAAAWSSQNPALLASFHAEHGSLSVNGGPPATGRAAIAAKAQAFMTAFPDMVVKLERMDQQGDRPIFRWLWTGTNTGPGGTGKFVRMTGYEEWIMDSNGLIAKSEGHYDEAEYQRQLKVGASTQP